MAAVSRSGKETSRNAAVWFVGVTKNLAATSALINFDSPNSASTGLPGIGNGKAYGDYASGVWLKAFGSQVHQKYSWPDPNNVSGQQVPDITGLSVSDATSRLAADHFKLSIVGAGDNLLCPDKNATTETIGYYGPTIAPAGSTILACQSLGVGQPVYTPPPPVVHKPRPGSTTTHAPKPGTTTGHSGGSGSGGSGSGSSGSGGGTNHGGGAKPPHH